MELVLVAVVTCAVLLPLRRVSPALTIVLILSTVVTAGVVWRERDRARMLDEKKASTVPRNRREGYVSSTACRACHPAQYESWHRSYHRTMTQVASPETVQARFDGATLTTDGQSYQLSRAGEPLGVTLPDGQRREIGLVTGSHHMQAFWFADGAGNRQASFPFTWLVDDARWVQRRDVFLVDDSVPWEDQHWNEICVECHATAGEPHVDLQGADTRVAELGIACEACHGPGAQHADGNRSPLRRYERHRTGDGDPAIVNPTRLDARAQVDVCGQCHGIKCNRRDWVSGGVGFRPGQTLAAVAPLITAGNALETGCKQSIEEDSTFFRSRYWPDGMVRVAGREANGVVASPCFRGGSYSCLACHQMHGDRRNMQLKDGADGDEPCLACHDDKRARLTAHTHHAAESAGSRCYNCHMPYTSYGLLRALRSHQVDSPDVRVAVETGRPQACNLCHLDRSLGWTARVLAAWYGTHSPSLTPEEERLPTAEVSLTSGDAAERAIVAWAAGWEPARRASGERWLAPLVADLLDDDYAAVRYIAGRTLSRQAPFAALRYDYVGDRESRRDAQRRARAIAATLAPEPGAPSLRPDDLTRLRAARDRRNVFLAE